MADVRPPRNWLGICFVIGILVVGGMFFRGWLRTGEIDGNPAVQLNATKIEIDSQKLLDKGSALVEGATSSMREEIDDRSRKLPE